jgi:aspartate kinase
MKFGGASVATPAHFQNVAQLIRKRCQEFERVVVVVSAMGDTTDQLIKLAREVHPEPPRRELDMLISVGERMSIALLAMALARLGIEAVSFTGSQSGIITTDDHTEARIMTVRPDRLMQPLEEGRVVIVAGFQGVSRKKEITTLGRGGSDTTAVALGVALGAGHIEFLKDVHGIYDRDPDGDPTAQLLPQLSFETALEIVGRCGHAILHRRCIELAQRNSLPLRILPFADPEAGGSWIRDERERASEPTYEESPLCT